MKTVASGLAAWLPHTAAVSALCSEDRDTVLTRTDQSEFENAEIYGRKQ